MHWIKYKTKTHHKTQLMISLTLTRLGTGMLSSGRLQTQRISSPRYQSPWLQSLKYWNVNKSWEVGPYMAVTPDLFDSEPLPAQGCTLLCYSLKKLHKYLPRCVLSKGSPSVKLLIFNNRVYMDELCVAIGSIYRGTYQIQRVKYLVSGDVVWRSLYGD